MGRINEWVSNKTEGKISRLLDSAPSPPMFLAGAVSGESGYSSGCALVNRPERKRLSSFKPGVSMVDKVQPSPLIRAEVWCVFSETKFIKCALAFFGPDLNGNEVLIAELVGT